MTALREVVVVAHQPGVGRAERDDHRTGERREVDDPLGALLDRVHEAVRQHEPALGVGVVDLDRLAVGRVTMSPGLTAPPLGRFSVAPTTRDELDRQLQARDRGDRLTTAAPPDMSNFISAIFAPGFSEMPPLSNVTALPTKPSIGAPRARRPAAS